MSNENLSETVAEILKDRVGDPWWRSFIFFFFTGNWKFFAALFLGSDVDPKTRITLACDLFSWRLVACSFFLSLLYPFYLWKIKPYIVGWYTRFNDAVLHAQRANKTDGIRKIETLEGRILDCIAKEELYKYFIENYAKYSENYKIFKYSFNKGYLEIDNKKIEEKENNIIYADGRSWVILNKNINDRGANHYICIDKQFYENSGSN